jgi:hypothetical protein
MRVTALMPEGVIAAAKHSTVEVASTEEAVSMAVDVANPGA